MVVRRLIPLALLAAACLPAQQKIQGPVIVFIGAPSSGKSTQAAIAAKAYGIPIISAEQMIRDNAQAFQAAQQPGITGILPRTDPLMNQIFAKRLEWSDVAKGFVLDGYPATNGHCDFIASLVQKGQLPNPVVLQLDVSDSVARKRGEKELGFNPDKFDQLLKDYHREMDMVKAYFPQATIIPIKGDKKVQDVSKEVKAALDQNLKK
jgi:adenylate kinase